MEDTEWNDVLRAKGILPPKPQQEAEITEDDLLDLVDKVIADKYGEKPLEERTLEELDEVEDEVDDRVLE
ncbi:Phosducin-like protein 3 [Quaeritorhiza haematococci]|nr:Phosducin-like protein 3 [Quaeritorhiza haematococci]